MNGLALLRIRSDISGLNFGFTGLFISSVTLLVRNLFNYRMTFGFGHRFAHFLVLRFIRNLDFRPTLLPKSINLWVIWGRQEIKGQFLPVLHFTMGLRYNL